jgi:hypothetical protein
VRTRTATSCAKQHVASADGDKLPDAKGGLHAMLIRRYKTREQARGYLASRGFQRILEGWRNGRWIGQVSRDDGGFWVEVWPPTAYGSSFDESIL